MATLNLGYYSLTALLLEVARAMNAADPVHSYLATANRTISGGTQNRITIATTGPFLSLLFGTGPRVASSTGPLLGFAAVDRTGSTSYTGTLSSGSSILTEYAGYNYLSPDFIKSNFGAISVSASGDKESISWSIQSFIQVEFKYEPESKVVVEWMPFMTWAIQQKLFEFTPNVSSPSVFYEVTLESTSADGKGLAYMFKEQLPEFPFNYATGAMKFRQKVR